MRSAPLVVCFLLVLASTANATTCTEAIGKCRSAGATKMNYRCQVPSRWGCLHYKKTGTFTGTVWKHLRKE
jgi:hypothetical protein